tara:strand:- start:1662 stop:4586 length:2925 start_codon:yes stop_codon:yes gene_type:complete
MTEDLNEFFSSIGKAKKEKEEEFKSLVGEDPLASVFKEVSDVKKKFIESKKEDEKKKKIEEDKIKTVIGDNPLESVSFFTQVSDLKKEQKEDRENKRKKLSEEKRRIEAEEKRKIEEEKQKKIKEEAQAQYKQEKEKRQIAALEDWLRPTSEEVVVQPEPVAAELTEEKDAVDQALEVLGTLKTKEEIRENVDDPDIKKIRHELEYLKNLISAQGGGGETRLQYLDDIVGVATNLNEYDGKFLKVDVTTYGQKFRFAEVESAGVGGTWKVDSVGIHTTKNIGVGAEAVSNKKLFVQGDAEITGNLSVAGTITKQDITNLDSIGIITGRKDLQIQGNSTLLGITTIGSNNVGSGATVLLVKGDARITGILTVGESSITIDGDAEQVSVGIVTITNTAVNVGENVTINSTASGINSAPNVLYVAKDGLDTNNGTSIDNAFLTIAAAVGIAQSGTTIKVMSGNYVEMNPIEVPAFVAIVGDDQRSVKVLPNTTDKDLFHVRKGDKLANMTFSGHLFPAAAVGFPTTEIAENVGGGKWKGPYIQNCTSDTTTGTGIRIDGSQARLLKAMNVDSFTQYNQGGVGVAVTNGGFAQLVSVFTICCDEAISCDAGGQADLANSNCSFGTKGLVARGTGSLQYKGTVSSTAAVSQDNVTLDLSTPTLNISNFDYTHTTGIATVTVTANHNFSVGMGVTLSGIGLTCAYGSKTYPHKRPYIFEVDEVPTVRKFVVNVGVSTLAHTYVSGGTAKVDIDRPYDGQVVYFDQLYNSVQTIAVGSGGTGYTSTPEVTVDAPSGPNGERATAFATLEGESVASITLISSGNQYTGTPNVTISSPNVGVNTATATATTSSIYYTINSSTPVVSGISTLTLDSNLLNSVGVGSTVFFFQQSKIIASSHTFEYVGSGNDITTATPKRGGVTVQENEVVTSDGGKVIYTSTDQAGNFRIGDDLQINQNTGTISGRAFSKSLFSEMTPFILALS